MRIKILVLNIYNSFWFLYRNIDILYSGCLNGIHS